MIDISVTDLVKSFDLEKKILDGISFQVDTGERVGLLGKTAQENHAIQHPHRRPGL